MYTKYLDKLESLEDKVVIVTGANSGLGYQTSLALAYKNARVIMACRNLEKAENAKNKILKLVPNAKIDICKYDQGSFESIEKLTYKLLNETEIVNIFLENVIFLKNISL